MTSAHDDIQRITVPRRHIFNDALSAFKRDFDATKPIRITFIGEAAIDAGGPCREFFWLLLQEVATNNSLFEGPGDSRVPAHNMLALKQHHFKYVGQIMAVSIVHGGPGPHCLSHAVVDYLTNGMSNVNAGVSDIPDFEIREKLNLVNYMCYRMDNMHHMNNNFTFRLHVHVAARKRR